jgi:F-type H+-transporting ATPase subunit b
MAASGLSDLVPYAINFSIVASAAVYFGREPVRKFVYQRHERMKDLIESASRAKKVAEKRYLEVQNKLQTITDESRKILSEAEQDAKTEASLLLSRADQEVGRLNTDTDRILRNEEESRANKLRNNMINLAIASAEQSLRKNLKKEDHSAIISRAKSRLDSKELHG